MPECSQGHRLLSIAILLWWQLLSEEEHLCFLELRLKIAESRSDHSFHCQTPNCRGWCIYEDEVNLFPCELCGETNCILCKVGLFVCVKELLQIHVLAPNVKEVVCLQAIHKGMNCKDYQDDLRIRAENDMAALQTKQMLEVCEWIVQL